jgi:hypothetical protein
VAEDGEKVVEGDYFETIDDAWAHSGDMGSRWIMYPYHFILSASGHTVVDGPDQLEEYIGRRTTTLIKAFKAFYAKNHTND